MNLLTVLLSLLGSGVVSAYVTQRLASSEKKLELKRDKLEKLYLAGIHYQSMLFGSLSSAAGYHAGKVTQQEFSTSSSRDVDKDKEANDAMTMLCNIYFPELVPFLKKILDIRDSYAEYVTEAMMGYPPAKKKAERLMQGLKPLFAAFDGFNAELFKVGLKINGK